MAKQRIDVMKRIIESSEALGEVDTSEGRRELCVTGAASYDEAAGQLSVKLDAFLRNTDLVGPEKHFAADWLPRAETARERVGPGETSALAREIFRRWVRKVREAAPPLHHV